MKLLITVFLLLTFASNQDASALEIEKFLMPGELISGHEEFEAECTLCHVRLRDTTQKKLCLDCHEEVASDIADNSGFHGKDHSAANQDCKTCHSDHRGRKAGIVWLDKDNFDHRLTDFELHGRHTQAECSACHATEEKYREARHGCYSCHSEDDAHEGKLGKKCAQCHTAKSWAKADFDHDKTAFKLESSHQKVTCNACHIGGQYKNTPDQCSDCHAIRDVHANRFGNKCQQCHSVKSWQQASFDHLRDTDYPLLGGHRSQSCNSCHGPGYKAPQPGGKVRDFYSCHRADDVHEGTNGENCKDCHDVKGWQQATFDHDANTDFALRGGHAELVCEACHVSGVGKSELQAGCNSCHRQDDVHQGSLGETCSRCHNDRGWFQGIRFDHDLGSFPLIGQHAALGCETCHSSPVFTETGSECIDCHRDEDIHQRSLGSNCSQCHNSNGWLIWRFDHDATNFALRYSHNDLNCQACHDKPLDSFSKSTWRCVDCHRREDVHDGNFGAHCGKCHNETKFSTPDIQSIKAYKPGSGRSSGTSP